MSGFSDRAECAVEGCGVVARFGLFRGLKVARGPFFFDKDRFLGWYVLALRRVVLSRQTMRIWGGYLRLVDAGKVSLCFVDKRVLLSVLIGGKFDLIDGSESRGRCPHRQA